jgi:hypothetical protein
MLDELLETLPMVAVLAELGALSWAFARKNIVSVVLVNSLAAAGLLLAVGPHLGVSFHFADVLLVLQVATVAFAMVTLATSVSWVAHPNRKPWMVWAEFAILAGLSGALLMLVVAFKSGHGV